MHAAIKTYGCTLNQSDSDLMESVLTRGGIAVSNQTGSADVVIFNTCTVKTPTEQKILHAIGKAEREGKRIVVTGCMASANQEMIEKHAPNASIVTTSNIDRIADAVEAAANGNRVVFNHYNRQDKLLLFSARQSVIAKVPINEGCLSSCTFCETKLARGPLNSFSEDRIVKAVELSARNGAKEIQLASQDEGAYGLDKGTNIAELMKKISAIGGDFRVRVGMLNPEHLSRYLESFIEQLGDERFYKFAHLPVQSGSDAVLKDMKRNYSVEKFAEYVDRLRSALPGITIETDIIVGFPTEKESDFEMTLQMIRELKPNVVNMAKFWARPNTAAQKMKQPDRETIVKRGIELTREVRRVQKGENDRYVGTCIGVVATESEKRSINCRTDSYKKVIVAGMPEAILGSRLNVNITRASCNVLYGEPAAL